MNRLNERYIDLVYYLFHETKWCSLVELSSKTNIPRSTLWRDLIFLGSVLPPGWVIEKNESYGVRLSRPLDGTLEYVWSYLKKENTYVQILNTIIMNNGVTAIDIADKLHISRSTVYRQLAKIEDFITTADVKITSSPYRLIGEEQKVRRFIMQFFEFCGKDIHTLFPMREFQSFLNKTITKHSISLHLGAAHRLALILYISDIRISQGNYVEYPDVVLATYRQSEHFTMARDIIHETIKPHTGKIKKRSAQIQETLFFTLYFVNEIKPVNKTKEILYKKKILREDPSNPVVVFLKEISDFINYDLTQNDDFFYDFIQTMRRTQFDSQYYTDSRFSSSLSFLPYVESNLLFSKINQIASSIFYENGFGLDKLEIFEIFMLVQSALLTERNKIQMKTALICRSYIENNFITEILKYHFGTQLNLFSMDSNNIELLQTTDEFDLVISTIYHLNDHGLINIPLVRISSFPSETELNLIKDFINRNFMIRIGHEDEFFYFT